MHDLDLIPEIKPSQPLRSLVLPALIRAQHAHGYVPDSAIEEIASRLRMTTNDVEAVATSYPEIRRAAPGRHLIRVCAGTPCWANGSAELLAALEQQLGVSTGETAEDGSVTLETIPCCFICGLAPAVEVDGRARGRATVDDVLAAIETSDLSRH